MSRSTGPLRKIVPALAVGLSAVLVGCSSGQVTQTDSIEPAVNGNRGNVGNIALRDVMIAFPEFGDYSAGDDAPLVLTIVNTGKTEDELVSVTSPASPDVQVLGDTALPGGMSLQVVVPDDSALADTTSAPETTESADAPESTEDADPSAPGGVTGTATEPSGPSGTETVEESVDTEPSTELDFGTIGIVLTDLVADLENGRNVPVTFVFAKAGTITVNLPIASPTTPRPDPEEDGGSGH